MTVKIKDNALEINFRFAAVLTFLLLFFPDGSAAVCFALCLAHETGHLAAMLLLGCVPRKIKLDFFGMRLDTGSRLISTAGELLIAAAGPAVNIAAAAVLHYMSFERAAVLSAGLAFFNLLPVPMLDGGRILSAFIRNEGILKYIGFAVCGLLLITGIYAAVKTKRNFTILAVSFVALTDDR